MTRNRDHMNLRDMLWVCGRTGLAIAAAMLLLGTMMVAHKPGGGLVLASATPPVLKRDAATVPTRRPAGRDVALRNAASGLN